MLVFKRAFEGMEMPETIPQLGDAQTLRHNQHECS